jgi:hypothetical protein
MKRELETCLGNVRGEYGPEDSGMERNDNEHPEQSYRRGVQHGAHFVLDPLLKAGLLDRATQRKLEKFVYLRIYNWRYAKHRRPRRHLAHDRPPQLELKPEGRSATTS